MVQLQYFILECLHHHTFFNMLFDGVFKGHCAQILSFTGLGVNDWFIIQLFFLVFLLFSPIFSITLRVQLGLPHPSIAGIPPCVCAHPINLMGIHFLHYVHGNERTRAHDAICDTFVAIA
jgi:hypothetical protein